MNGGGGLEWTPLWISWQRGRGRQQAEPRERARAQPEARSYAFGFRGDPPRSTTGRWRTHGLVATAGCASHRDAGRCTCGERKAVGVRSTHQPGAERVLGAASGRPTPTAWAGAATRRARAKRHSRGSERSEEWRRESRVGTAGGG
eukprot:ctg_3571.g535